MTRLLNRTAMRIALFTALLCTSLLILLNFVVLNRSRNAFLDSVSGKPFTVASMETPSAGSIALSTGGLTTTIPQSVRVSGSSAIADGVGMINLNENGMMSSGTITASGGTTGILPVSGTLLPTATTSRLISFQATDPLSQLLLQHFTNTFQNSLIWVTLLGIVASIGMGFLISRLFAKPLGRLEKGMQQLRDSNYAIALEPTGNADFDGLIAAFNHLTRSLAAAEALRKELISDTSHELKTPLTSLRGQLEGIKDGVLNWDKERMDLLLSQVDRLNGLVDTLQEYARLRSKIQKMALTNFYLKPFLKNALAPFEPQFHQAKLKTTLHIDDKFVITADKSLLARLLTNLIQNTLQYAEATELTIVANDKQIIVQDNGVGIPAVHLDKIFERFYRVEKSRSRDTGGLGLGLAIVKEIAAAHGWEITAIPNRETTGVAFVMTLTCST